MISGSTAVAQLFGICALPFVTRLYTPAEIGTVSLFLSFFSFWTCAIAMRYEQALVITADDSESHIVQRLAAVLVFLMSLLGVPVLWLLQYNNILEFQLLPFWAPLIAFPIFVSHGLAMVYRSWALRAGLVQHINKAVIARAVVTAGTKLGFGIFSGGIVGLFVAELVGAGVSLKKLMHATHSHFVASKPKHIGFTQLCQSSVKFSKFPMLETPSAWVDALAMTLPLPLIANLYGVEAAGWFGLARMVISLPNAQIGSAVADVFQMELAKAVRENDGGRALDLFYLLFKQLSLIGFLLFVGSILCLPWLIPLVFGQNWVQSGNISASLAPWLCTAFIVSPLSRALSVLQVQELKLIYDITDLSLLLGCYILAKLLGMNLIEFCLLISIAKALSYAVYALVLFKQVNSRLKIIKVE
jgi:O-antigen/teichoic acid export membrane protein